MVRYSLSFAGAGRVAGALCREMHRIGHKIDKIVSPGPVNGKQLASECAAIWSDIHDYGDQSDIIIVSVPDHLLETVLRSIKCSPDTLVVHTAGSYGTEVFPQNILLNGVFYPLQTFTRGRKPDFRKIPFLIESGEGNVRTVLGNLAASFGAKTLLTTTEERRKIHLAAVFGCNFVNHMLTIAGDLSSSASTDFSLLKPLVEETISKAFAAGPELSQTGPAVRNDENTINKHLAILSEQPLLAKIYRDISESIKERHK